MAAAFRGFVGAAGGRWDRRHVALGVRALGTGGCGRGQVGKTTAARARWASGSVGLLLGRGRRLGTGFGRRIRSMTRESKRFDLDLSNLISLKFKLVKSYSD